MIGKRILFTGIAMGALILASLGCCLCPPVPQRAPTATPRPTRTPRPTATLRPTATPRPTAMLQPATEMETYTNPAMGFRLSYPAGWVYDDTGEGIIFAESEEALELNDPTQVPLFGVLAGTPDDVEEVVGEPGVAETPQTLLDGLLEALVEQEGYESDEVEPRTFGAVPGVGVKVSWEESSGESVVMYLAAAVGDGVAGFAIGIAPQDDWPDYAPVFRDMLDSLEFFPPEVTGPVERYSLSPGETMTGTLPSGGLDVWTFDATGDQYVTIRVDALDPEGNLDVYVTVYDESRTAIGWDDDSGGGYSALVYALHLPEAGRYEIEVSAISGSGDYAITLTEVEAPLTEAPRVSPIAYGETASGRLTGETPRERWVFEGRAGDVVNISMIGRGDLTDTVLELYGPGDEWLISNDDSLNDAFARILNYVLPESGAYTIVAGGYSGLVGPYHLTLERVEFEEFAIAYGQTQSGKLKPAMPQERWVFEGRAGDVVNISMIGYGDLSDTSLELYDADGALLISNDDSLNDDFARILGYTLPASGTYTIVARSYSSQSGRYDLTLQKVTIGAIAYGSTVVGRLTGETPQEYWAFEGAAGDTVRIEMIGRGDLLDTYLELYGPDGQLLTENDDSGPRYSALIDGYTLPTDGTYRIVARSYDGELGAYQLSLERVE